MQFLLNAEQNNLLAQFKFLARGTIVDKKHPYRPWQRCRQEREPLHICTLHCGAIRSGKVKVIHSAEKCGFEIRGIVHDDAAVEYLSFREGN